MPPFGQHPPKMFGEIALCPHLCQSHSSQNSFWRHPIDFTRRDPQKSPLTRRTSPQDRPRSLNQIIALLQLRLKFFNPSFFARQTRQGLLLHRNRPTKCNSDRFAIARLPNNPRHLLRANQITVTGNIYHFLAMGCLVRRLEHSRTRERRIIQLRHNVRKRCKSCTFIRPSTTLADTCANNIPCFKVYSNRQFPRRQNRPQFLKDRNPRPDIRKGRKYE